MIEVAREQQEHFIPRVIQELCAWLSHELWHKHF